MSSENLGVGVDNQWGWSGIVLGLLPVLKLDVYDAPLRMQSIVTQSKKYINKICYKYFYLKLKSLS